MHSCGVAARREEPVGSERLGDGERALRGPPERGLAPSLRTLEGDRLERGSGKRVGRDDVRDAELPGNRLAVAVVAVEELEHRRCLPELPCTREGRLEANRVDEPHSAFACESMRCAGHRLVDDPREPLRTAVVAEANRHVASVRRRRVERVRSRRPVRPSNRPQGHPGVPDVTLARISRRVCADSVPTLQADEGQTRRAVVGCVAGAPGFSANKVRRRVN